MDATFANRLIQISLICVLLSSCSQVENNAPVADLTAPNPIKQVSRAAAVAPVQEVVTYYFDALELKAPLKNQEREKEAAQPGPIFGQTNRCGPFVWQYPANGRRLQAFLPETKGVDIAGQLGDPIYAAAAGKVVYSGKGLRGYGNLIILSHAHFYFSAYAHNQSNLVKEGQNVTARQQIGLMGDSGALRVMLHFEIRRGSKPIDPWQCLQRS